MVIYRYPWVPCTAGIRRFVDRRLGVHIYFPLTVLALFAEQAAFFQAMGCTSRGPPLATMLLVWGMAVAGSATFIQHFFFLLALLAMFLAGTLPCAATADGDPLEAARPAATLLGTILVSTYTNFRREVESRFTFLVGERFARPLRPVLSRRAILSERRPEAAAEEEASGAEEEEEERRAGPADGDTPEPAESVAGGSARGGAGAGGSRLEPLKAAQPQAQSLAVRAALARLAAPVSLAPPPPAPGEAPEEDAEAACFADALAARAGIARRFSVGGDSAGSGREQGRAQAAPASFVSDGELGPSASEAGGAPRSVESGLGGGEAPRRASPGRRPPPQPPPRPLRRRRRRRRPPPRCRRGRPAERPGEAAADRSARLSQRSAGAASSSAATSVAVEAGRRAGAARAAALEETEAAWQLRRASLAFRGRLVESIFREWYRLRNFERARRLALAGTLIYAAAVLVVVFAPWGDDAVDRAARRAAGLPRPRPAPPSAQAGALLAVQLGGGAGAMALLVAAAYAAPRFVERAYEWAVAAGLLAAALPCLLALHRCPHYGVWATYTGIVVNALLASVTFRLRFVVVAALVAALAGASGAVLVALGAGATGPVLYAEFVFGAAVLACTAARALERESRLQFKMLMGKERGKIHALELESRHASFRTSTRALRPGPGPGPAPAPSDPAPAGPRPPTPLEATPCAPGPPSGSPGPGPRIDLL
eukprot:tig00000498_g1663.t1